MKDAKVGILWHSNDVDNVIEVKNSFGLQRSELMKGNNRSFYNLDD